MDTTRRRIVTSCAAIALAVLAAVPAATAGDDAARQASEQIERGFVAAKNGYWQEALFRFSRAQKAVPDDEVILNNLAVAQEALGRYDDALATYKLALKKAPKNTVIRKNYARFAEFFTSYARGAKPKGDDGATR